MKTYSLHRNIDATPNELRFRQSLAYQAMLGLGGIPVAVQEKSRWEEQGRGAVSAFGLSPPEPGRIYVAIFDLELPEGPDGFPLVPVLSFRGSAIKLSRKLFARREMQIARVQIRAWDQSDYFVVIESCPPESLILPG